MLTNARSYLKGKISFSSLILFLVVFLAILTGVLLYIYFSVQGQKISIVNLPTGPQVTLLDKKRVISYLESWGVFKQPTFVYLSDEGTRKQIKIDSLVIKMSDNPEPDFGIYQQIDNRIILATSVKTTVVGNKVIDTLYINPQYSQRLDSSQRDKTLTSLIMQHLYATFTDPTKSIEQMKTEVQALHNDSLSGPPIFSLQGI